MAETAEKYIQVTGPDRPHTVYQYTGEIYKFIQWVRVFHRAGPGPKDQQKHHEKKLDSSVSRTRRMLLEKALCNQWDWFCTFTIAKEKYDREDLANWGKKFTQWMRDLRKKGRNIQYLLVPEKHLDGSWHAHGFLAGLLPEDVISFREMDAQGYRTPRGRRLPPKLLRNDYYNWTGYSNKFGYCSLGRIKNRTAAAFYITKYASKDKERMVQDLGLNSYYSSQGLNVAHKFVDFYGRDAMIDQLLTKKYEWCATGMTRANTGIDWDICLTEIADKALYSDWGRFTPMSFDFLEEGQEPDPAELEADELYEMSQVKIPGWS